jgi:hypothetical protein
MTGPPTEVKKAAWKIPEKTTYDIHLHGLSLLVRRPLVSEELYSKHTRLLASGKPALYYYTKTQNLWSTIPSGVRSHMSPELFSVQGLPGKIYIIFQSQTRLVGDLTKSIHVFEKPENLESVNLYLDSKPLSNFITPDSATMSTGLLNFLYLNLFKTTQTFYTNHVPEITRSEFEKHCFILAFDLSSGNSIPEDSLPLVLSGSLRMRMEFSSPTTEVLNCLTFGLAPSLLTIDQNRSVAVSTRE